MTLLPYNQCICTEIYETRDGIPFFITDCKYKKDNKLIYDIMFHHVKRYIFPFNFNKLIKSLDIIKNMVSVITINSDKVDINYEDDLLSIILSYTSFDNKNKLSIKIEGSIDDDIYECNIEINKNNLSTLYNELYCIFKELSNRGN